MGADVALVRVHRVGSNPSRWRRVCLESVLDSGDHFAKLCDGCGLPMLERVDPYGSLVLSGEEMGQFLAELTVLGQRENARPHRALLDRIRRLGQACAADGDLRLCIDGD